MNISFIDWAIIAAFFIISMLIGVFASRTAGASAKEFFLSGRNMPWWLLGVSMVATTFSADTPNLVTDIVRKQGVSGNWVWWAFLLTGMLTVFVYAKLWRRSELTTDLEFYEMRYSGKPAAFLRAFRALYLGVFFNVVIMATVSLAAIKIGGVMLGLSPTETLLLASVVTVIYSSLGGLKGVGEAAIDSIIEERAKKGPYKNIFDFIKRVNQRTVNKKSLESLVYGGAFDCFTEYHRAQYFHVMPGDTVNTLERIINFGNRFQANVQSNTNTLFGESMMMEIPTPKIVNCEEWTLTEKLDHEKEITGIFISGHPLDHF